MNKYIVAKHRGTNREQAGWEVTAPDGEFVFSFLNREWAEDFAWLMNMARDFRNPCVITITSGLCTIPNMTIAAASISELKPMFVYSDLQAAQPQVDEPIRVEIERSEVAGEIIRGEL